MLIAFSTTWAWLNDHALAIFGVGLGLIVLFNLWHWRADHVRALQIKARSVEPIHFKATPRVTVLVAAWNEAAHIVAHLQSVCALSYPNKEYVLCTGGQDGTYALACQHAARVAWMKILEQQPGEGKQRSLRRGLSLATGDIIFLTDADCLLTDESFERTVAPLINEEEAVATGTSEPLPDQRLIPLVLYQQAIQMYSTSGTGEYSSGLLGRNCAVSRQALEVSGGFEQQIRTGTDYYLARQLLGAGFRLRVVTSSRIATDFPRDLISYLRQQTRWLRNLWLHGYTTHDWGHVRHALLTFLLGCSGLILPFLGFVLGSPVVVLWSWVVAYSIMARLRYLAFAHILGAAISFSVVPISCCVIPMDWLIAVLALVESATPKLRWKW